MSQQPSSSQSNSNGSVSDSYPGINPAAILDDETESGQHALVIGCGIAGMAAAQVLSQYFQRVTIIERDQLPEQPKFRAGKPQGRHAHVLLAQGLRHLEQIFPGLAVRLREQGAFKWQWGPEPHWYHFGGWRAEYPTALTTILCSVNLLEVTMRRYLQRTPQVRILTECTVDGLLSSGQRVTGLRVQHHRKGRGQKTIELRGALVVDTTGRRSVAREWLSKLGIGPLKETKVEAFWGYASRYYERPSQQRHTWRVLAIHPTPPDSPRSGLLFPLENNLWLVTLAGTNRDYPPDDDAGFLEFTRGLAQPDLFEAIQNAKPVSGIYGYRFAENRLNHFEKLERSLEGFVALGDAVCQFNPIYGQGMSVAAIGAARLDRCLKQHLRRHPDRDLRGLARTFQRGLASDLRVPWLITTSEDMRFAKPDAKSSLLTRFVQGFVRNLIELAAKDQQAYRSFVSVMHLVSSPLRLLHPWLLLKVLLQALFAPPRAPTSGRVRSPQFVSAGMARSGKSISGEAWTPHPVDPPGSSGDLQRPISINSPAPSSVSGPLAASAATPSRLWRDRSEKKPLP
jgi:2-polyprenyl-6-methoxyphenol hydroxylase-like FAD-dependent oxidoreductase